MKLREMTIVSKFYDNRINDNEYSERFSEKYLILKLKCEINY